MSAGIRPPRTHAEDVKPTAVAGRCTQRRMPLCPTMFERITFDPNVMGGRAIGQALAYSTLRRWCSVCEMTRQWGRPIVFCGLPTQGRKTSAGVGARLWSEPPACHAAIPGGILSAGRCPQESGHGRPEAHSTGANQGVSPTIGVFHEIPRAAGPLQQTGRPAPLRGPKPGTSCRSRRSI